MISDHKPEPVQVVSELEPELQTNARPLRRDPTSRLAKEVDGVVLRRPWTTRLQNSIRNMVPSFTSPLVSHIITSTANRSPEKALRFFRWVEKTGFVHDQQTYGLIINVLTSNLMLNHARCMIFEDMPKRNLKPTEQMLADLIAGYGDKKIPQEAVKMFKIMPEIGVERTVLTYDVFFKAILKNGRTMMAKRVFNFMVKEGVTPALSTYNVLIWGFSLSKKMETARRFFEDVKSKGLGEDIVTYNMILNGWVRANKIDEAEKIWESIKSVGLEPNLVSYNLMIKGYMGSGKIDEGLSLFNEMKKKEMKLSERSYASLMPWLCDDVERVGEAKKIFDEMAEKKVTPRDKNKSVFLRLIASMLESGDLDGVVEVHKSMDKFRVRLDSQYYGLIIEGLCRGDRYSVAVEIVDEFLERKVLAPFDSAPLEPSAYNPMIGYLCDSGLTSKAETLFRQLMKRGVDDKTAFNNLIRGHAKEGNPESAFEILSIMTRRGVESDADAYVLLVESFLKKGEPADARTVLDGMIEQGHMPTKELFRSVMVALFDDGRVQTASRVMKNMIEKGVKENMDIVQKILEALFMRGHVEEALGRINLLLENDLSPDLDSLVVSLCECNKTVPAIKLVDFGLERNLDFDFSSYDKLLDTLYNNDKIMPAYSILCKIKAKGGAVDMKGCEAIIKSLNEQGKTGQADSLSRMLAGKVSHGKKGKRVIVDA